MSWMSSEHPIRYQIKKGAHIYCSTHSFIESKGWGEEKHFAQLIKHLCLVSQITLCTVKVQCSYWLDTFADMSSGLVH